MILDTSVVIEAERTGRLDFVDADSSEIGIAAITAGELLVGVHRGSPAARAIRRRVTIEALDGGHARYSVRLSRKLVSMQKWSRS